MRTRFSITILLAIAAVTIPMFTCFGREKQPTRQGEGPAVVPKEKENIWKDEGPGRPGGPRMEPGPGGPGMGPGPGPRGRRFELTDEEIERVLQAVKEKDPEKAKELRNLRKTDPERFQRELREAGHDEVDKIFKERFEKWRRQRQAEFVEWLKKNYARAAEELVKLEQKSPGLYAQKFDYLREKYWHIFEQEKINPELAEVLKADLELRERCDEILRKLKEAKDENTKSELQKQLEAVVADRFDLIVRKKELIYEHLLKRLEELQKEVKESREEIKKWKDENFKDENVKKRVRDLIGGRTQFRWD